MQALMAARLLGVAGLDARGEDPQASPPGRAVRAPAQGRRGPGPPGSVRRRVGHPNAVNQRVHTGFASATRVEASA